MVHAHAERGGGCETGQAALRRGDKVVTGGGIIGTVARVPNDDEVVVDIADGVRVRVLRGTITSILTKGTGDDSGTDAEKPAKAGK